MSHACSYLLTDEQMCKMPVDIEESAYCTEHENRACIGCGDEAHRECPALLDGGPRKCGKDICYLCDHEDDGQHRMAPDPALNPAYKARDDLVETVTLALKEMGQAGTLRFGYREAPDHVAEVIVDRMSANVLLKVLSGVASITSEK